MTEAAIDTRLHRRPVRVARRAGHAPTAIAGAWGVRIYVKPFIDWIWGGCILMALGGFLAIADRRYRIAVQDRVAAAIGAAQA